MRRYHHPHLQGLFAHKYPENWFGYVQPREDLRDFIILLDFRPLPKLATQALQTLAREDLTPRHSLDESTDTEVTTHIHRLCMQPQPPDPEIFWQAVLDILAEGGHDHLLPPELEDYPSDKGLEVNDNDTPPMSLSRRIEMVQRMQLEPQGQTAQELLNPTRVTTTPWRSAAASPVKQSPIPLGLAQHMSGWQMDANCNQRAHSKHTSSPAPLNRNKHAKNPTREKQSQHFSKWDHSTRPALLSSRHCPVVG